jgi:molybdate transport system substrate-binding protein
MFTLRRLRTLLALALVAAFASIGAHAQGDSQTLIVFAAASLTDAFTEIAADFEAANPGVEIIYNFGSSTQLAAQLAEGAPADLFASANAAQMRVAQEAGRVAGAPRTFVKNRLVLIAPADNPAGITGLADLANPGLALVVAAPAVPVRDYTETMFDRLAADPGYGEAYSAAARANIASEEENVRSVAAKVALGEADAGVVYISDVTPDLAADVLTFPIPDALNTIATYPIATTNGGDADPALATAFVDYVLSDAGQETLVRWNFISARIPETPATLTLPSDGTLTIDGQVINPLSLTVESLAEFTPYTQDVTYLSGEDSVTTAFTGALLWDVLNAAQPNLNADVRNDKLSTYLIVTASDGYQALIAWGEIDPEFANQPILLAYEQAGEPIADSQGPIRLVVPGDARGGRYVSGVVNISLRDAPPAP